MRGGIVSVATAILVVTNTSVSWLAGTVQAIAKQTPTVACLHTRYVGSSNNHHQYCVELIRLTNR